MNYYKINILITNAKEIELGSPLVSVIVPSFLSHLHI